VELKESEKSLLAQIDFEPSLTGHNAEAALANGEAAHALAKSLMERQTIPELRIRWFTDPAYNVGGHGASRKDVFAKYGTRGDNILRHPHFLKHLR
jgi:hypothetical protein